MPLASGTRLGPYEILAPIGAGGMGQVYTARDTRLNRVVAVKTSAAQFSERFEREARAIAAFNHPHVCALYDVGPDYLVMEYIEGSEIKGPLPPASALKYAIQLADALEAAHRKGIVHRDLKPANILLTRSGVKVLDFGLARIDESKAATLPDRTLTEALTQEGAIVGTLQYMAPEQLQGQPADARSDIFSFGCVLYEMLTGRRAFDGANAASVIAAILERPAPDLAGIAPAGLDWVLRRCLAKEPIERWQSISDVRAVLERIAERSEETAPTRIERKPRMPWIAAGLCALAAIAVSALYLGGNAPAPELRLDIATPPTISPASFALSPDGRRIAYVATVDGVSRLWVRAFNSTSAEPVPGTEDARNPFWSPDGNWLGFLVDLDLKRVPLGGGSPQTVLSPVAPLVTQATWGVNDVFLDAEHHELRLITFGTNQNLPRPLRTSKQTIHRAPRFLPDSKEFLFLADGEDAGIWLASLAGTPPRRVAPITPETDSAAEYLQSGWLVRVRQTALVAQRFDAKRAELAGEPVELARGVGLNPDNAAGAFSVSASGAVAWREGASTRRQLMWFDRSGRELGAFGPADPLLFNPEISPDGQRVALTRGRIDLSDIWIQEGSRSNRFTSDPDDDRISIWSPDGKEIAFASRRGGMFDLYRKAANGLGPETPLLKSDDLKFPCSWSPDGRFLLYWTNLNRGDLMVLPLEGDRKPFPFLSTQFSEETGVFSRDGKWVAYNSNESGRWEVYVRPFPGPGPAWQVSTAGGRSARWSADGKELYYLAPDSTLMAARVTRSASTFETATPQVLFRTRAIYFPNAQQYDVSRDGRFLVARELEITPPEPIHVLLNWKPPAK